MAGAKHSPLSVDAADSAVLPVEEVDQSTVSLLQKLAASQEAVNGAHDPRLADTYSALAAAYEAAGDFHNAQSALARALDIRSRYFGKDNLVIAHTMMRQAELHERLSDLPQAERLYTSALACSVRHFGIKEPETVQVIDRLRHVLTLQSRNPDEASKLAAGFANAVMNDSLEAFPCDQYREMGEAALKLRNYKEAERIFMCLRDVIMALSPNSVHYAHTLELLSDTYYLQERKEEAFRIRERAQQKFESLLGADDPKLLRFAAKTAELRKETDYIVRAQKRMDKIASFRPAVLAAAAGGIESVAVVAAADDAVQVPEAKEEAQWKVYLDDGVSALNENRYLAAERLLSVAVEKAEIFAPRDARLWDTMCKLAMAYNGGGKLFKAASLYQQVVRKCEEVYGAESPSIVPYIETLAGNHSEQGEFIKEKECYERIVRIYVAAQAPEAVIAPYQARLHEL